MVEEGPEDKDWTDVCTDRVVLGRESPVGVSVPWGVTMSRLLDGEPVRGGVDDRAPRFTPVRNGHRDHRSDLRRSVSPSVLSGSRCWVTGHDAGLLHNLRLWVVAR